MIESSEKIEEKSDELRSLFYALGRLISSEKERPPVGKALLDRVISLRGQIEDIELLMEREEKMIQERSRAEDEICELDKSIKNDPGLLKSLYSKLGAIIYERASLELIKREHFGEAYLKKEEEEAIIDGLKSKNPLIKALFKMKEKTFSALKESLFEGLGKKAIENKSYIYIGGEQSQNIAEKIIKALDGESRLRDRKKSLEDRISLLDDEIKEIRGYEKSPFKERLEEKKRDYYEAAVSYGNYLYEKGEIWISENTSSEALDLVEAILSSQKEYSDLKERKRDEERRAKREEIRILISQEEDKLDILEREKKRIDSHMDEIKKEIKRLESFLSKNSFF